MYNHEICGPVSINLIMKYNLCVDREQARHQLQFPLPLLLNIALGNLYLYNINKFVCILKIDRILLHFHT